MRNSKPSTTTAVMAGSLKWSDTWQRQLLIFVCKVCLHESISTIFGCSLKMYSRVVQEDMGLESLKGMRDRSNFKWLRITNLNSVSAERCVWVNLSDYICRTWSICVHQNVNEHSKLSGHMTSCQAYHTWQSCMLNTGPAYHVLCRTCTDHMNR